MVGGDELCCTPKSYSDTLNHPCRKCNVIGSELANPDVVCRPVKMTTVMKLYQEEKAEAIAEIGNYNVWCAWYDVDFGGCEYVFYCNYASRTSSFSPKWYHGSCLTNFIRRIDGTPSSQ